MIWAEKGGDVMNREQVIHDLALIHAREKYHEFFQLVAPKDRKSFPNYSDLEDLLGFYKVAKTCFSEHLDMDH